MYQRKDQAFHHQNNNISSSREPSRTFHSFQLGGSAPSALPNFNFPKRDILFGSITRIRSLVFDTNRVRTLNGPEPTIQVGLGVVGELARAPINTNKNLLLRPLVTTHIPTHIPMVNPWARPMSPTRPVGPNSWIPSGDHIGNGRANRTRISGDEVVLNEGSVELANSPRKKAKRSKGGDVEDIALYYYPTSAFMRYCFECGKKLKHTENIYIYRGEMAFCSNECREREVFRQEKAQRRSEFRDQGSGSTSRTITRKPTLRDLRER